MFFFHSVVGAFDGLITLPRIADMCEAIGRFLRDICQLSQVSFFPPIYQEEFFHLENFKKISEVFRLFGVEKISHIEMFLVSVP